MCQSHISVSQSHGSRRVQSHSVRQGSRASEPRETSLIYRTVSTVTMRLRSTGRDLEVRLQYILVRTVSVAYVGGTLYVQ